MLHAKDSYDIYTFLAAKNLLKDSPKYWWPNAGTFEVVVGAVLTQNTSWNNVEKSLHNLEGYLTLEKFATLKEEQLKTLIRPSGFYNQKAPRLLQLTRNIISVFQTFEHFQNNVSRGWLLEQKGIGQESADAILCYGCFREEMVVDTYTKRLLKDHFGIEFHSYTRYKAFLEEGIETHFDKDRHHIYAQFHGMIVEFNKKLV